MKKRIISLLLIVVMLVGMVPAIGITAGAEESAAGEADAFDVVYEEGFNSGLWTVEPKTVSTGYSEYNYTPTAPTVKDGALYMKKGDATAFWWSKIPGVKEKGVYTLTFDVDITNKGNNKSLVSETVWKRELNISMGGYWSTASFRSDNKRIMASGSGFTDDDYASDTYSVKIVWDNTKESNTIKTTITKGDFEAYKGKTISSTEAWYEECSQFWGFRCEDGEVVVSNFTFTDGSVSISGFESIGESYLTTEGEGLWTLEHKAESVGYSKYNYNPTAPFGYDGRLYMEEGDAVSLWWKNIPGVADKGVYTITFDVDITDNGNNKSLISDAIWKRELNVALGGYWSTASFRNDTKVIIASGSGVKDENYGSDTYSVKIVWDNTTDENTVKTTITKGDFENYKGKAISASESWYEECSQIWSFRCEDGAAEISNFKFSAVNYVEPVSVTEVTIPEGKQAIYECDISYSGEEAEIMMGNYQLFSIAESGISMYNAAVSGSYGYGIYHVKATANPAQKLITTEITLPDGGTVRRGVAMSDTESSFMASVYGADGCVANISVAYEDITADEYTVNTTEPVYEGFGANVYNIVTSFTDARYDRAFAWTALEAFVGDEEMAVKYRAVGESEWTTVTALKETETLSDTENYYEADITGLKANTVYEYKIGKKNSSDEENDWSKTYTFTTDTENIKDFSFIALGDNQGHSWDGSTKYDKGYMYTQTAITQALSKLSNPAFIMNTGDMTETNSPTEWNWYFKSIGELLTSVPHFATIGGGKHDNHDFFDMHFNHPNNGGKDAYTNVDAILNATPTGADIVNYLDETVYSFNYGDVHFIVIDSGAAGHANSRILMQEQREWLQADLEANKDAKWKILITHQPAYHQIDANYNRAFLADIVEGYGVDLVLSGHSHSVARSYPIKNGEIVTKVGTSVIEKGLGTIYATIGSTTVNHDTLSNPNNEKLMSLVTNNNLQPIYTVVDLKGNTLTVTIRQADGLVIDTFSIVGEDLCKDGHSYDAVVTAPTCTEGGYTTYTCSDCGDTYVGDYTEAIGHRFSGLVVNNATCTEDGWINISCGNCGNTWDSRYDDEAKQYLANMPYINVTAKGHAYDNDFDADCNNCGETRPVPETEGELNTKITWTYADGVLTVTGKGKIKNFSAGKAPWAALVDYVETVVIGEGITYVGASAFYSMTNVTTVVLPDTLTAIGNYAFYGCSALNSVSIPENVTEIGAYAFRRTSVTTAIFVIGYGWSAGDNAFSYEDIVAGGANYLTVGFYKNTWTRDVNAEVETIDPNFVDGGVCGNNIKWTITKLENGKLKLTVSGEGAMPTFGTAKTPWFGYAADIVEIEVTEGVTTIGRCAFYGLKFVRKATIASTVTAIDDYGFYMCFLLKSINLPEGVTVGTDAFKKTGVTL